MNAPAAPNPKLPHTRRMRQLLAALAAPAQATTTGNALLEWCAEARDRGMCIGYSQATIEGLGGFCPPEGVTLGQAIKIVVKYLNANPEYLHLRGMQLAMDAVVEAWPCEK